MTRIIFTAGCNTGNREYNTGNMVDCVVCVWWKSSSFDPQQKLFSTIQINRWVEVDHFVSSANSLYKSYYLCLWVHWKGIVYSKKANIVYGMSLGVEWSSHENNMAYGWNCSVHQEFLAPQGSILSASQFCEHFVRIKIQLNSVWLL
jgi:hypothetical protein